MKDIYIIGAGGFGREVAQTIAAINKEGEPRWRIAAFVDDDENKHGSINGIDVINSQEFKELCKAERKSAIIAIGTPEFKKKLASEFDVYVNWENIIHPLTSVSEFAEIGVGNVFQAFSMVAPNVTIGNHCCVNTRSGIGHDAVVGDYVSIMSICDITGGCRLGDRVYVATTVSIIPEIVVGEGAYICAGSVVFKDVPQNAKMMGNPARQIK